MKQPPIDTVILYSGGLDSTTLLLKAIYEDNRNVCCITFNYGSKHNERENHAAFDICHLMEVPICKVELPFFSNLLISDLLKTGGDIPEGHYAADNMKSTVVPFRNGILLSIAAGYAESMGAAEIAIAAHAGDHTIYPDCRTSFLNSMSEAIFCGTAKQINIYRPFHNMTKAEIAKLGVELDMLNTTPVIPMTWSCYKGGHKHCGKCGTCIERIEAFKLNGLIDGADYNDGVVNWE